MKIRNNVETIASTRTSTSRSHLTRAALVLLLGTFALGLADLASALVGNGYTVWQWGTRKDKNGIAVGSASNRTCFLSGVAGNLNLGGEWDLDEESAAWVGRAWKQAKFTDDYWLFGHGGAYGNQVNEVVWQNNPVNAQATCFWTATGVKESQWKPGNNNLPVKIAELSTGNTNVRQCFLSGLFGVAGAWNSSTNFAGVLKRTKVDATHPTTGWYIEANLPFPAGMHPRVDARCVEFPQGTVISENAVSAVAGATKTVAITSGPGVKACALTGIAGAWNVNNWTDGAMMSFPAKIDGNWSLTVNNNKTAWWACAR